MNVLEIQREYHLGTSDIALAKRYNLSLKKIREIVDDNPNSKQKETFGKEKNCPYCNKTIYGRNRYCKDHRTKKQRSEIEDGVVSHSIIKTSRHPSLSMYEQQS